MTQKICAFSKSAGSSEAFVYLNYANANQDPLGSYGAANVKFIKRVAREHDLTPSSSAGYQVVSRSPELIETVRVMPMDQESSRNRK